MTGPDRVDGALQAMFFDFDGVILDSVEIKVEAFRDMYAQYGRSVVEAVERYQRLHGGVGRARKFEHFESDLLGQPATPDRIEALCDEYSRRVEEKVTACPWIAGARQFLEAWSARLPMYVISGTPEEELLRIARRRGVRGHFRIMRGSPTTKDDAIREFLTDGPYAPDRTVMIGDSLTDLEAARATDTRFIGVVPAGARSMFPDDVPIVPNLTELAAAAGLS